LVESELDSIKFWVFSGRVWRFLVILHGFAVEFKQVMSKFIAKLRDLLIFDQLLPT
jgi:hypothetical protein